MIKINLISDEPTVAATKRKAPEFSLGEKQGDIILLIMLALAMMVVGARWWMLNSEVNDLKSTEAARRAERDELQQYIDKVVELEAKRTQLQTKIDTIRQLKEKQQGPVRILDEVSKTLPDLVWFTTLDLKGNHLTLNGMALDENAIATYISNLHASPFFAEPTLVNIQRAKQDSFSFKLECNFTYLPTGIASVQGAASS